MKIGYKSTMVSTTFCITNKHKREWKEKMCSCIPFTTLLPGCYYCNLSFFKQVPLNTRYIINLSILKLSGLNNTQNLIVTEI